MLVLISFDHSLGDNIPYHEKKNILACTLKLGVSQLFLPFSNMRVKLIHREICIKIDYILLLELNGKS